MTVRPFPFGALPAVSREEMVMTQRLRDATRSFDEETLAQTLAELCGETISIAIRRTQSRNELRSAMDTVGILFAPPEVDGLARAVFVEIESGLSAVLVTRALRQRAPRITNASQPPSPAVAGAIAALLHAVLRRAHETAPVRVIAAGPAQALGRDFIGAHRRVVTVWLDVVVGGDRFDARVSVPIAELPPPRETRTARAPLGAMADAAIALPLVAATCLSTRMDLASLRSGDVFVVPGFALHDAEGHLVGPVALVPQTAERGLAADLAESGRLVLRTERIASHPWDRSRWSSEEPAMSGEPNATLEVLEDVPVVVRIELGTVEMKVGEFAALGAGDVLALGRKLGDPAILRVGGVEVARGELVQVDGEYGVRVLGRTGGA